MELLVYCIIPTRINILFLGFAFDFLPHHGLEATPQEDRFKTTRNRVGLERLMNADPALPELPPGPSPAPADPVLPLPAASGGATRRATSEQDTPLSTFGGRRVSVEEYRRRRGLDS